MTIKQFEKEYKEAIKEYKKEVGFDLVKDFKTQFNTMEQLGINPNNENEIVNGMVGELMDYDLA